MCVAHKPASRTLPTNTFLLDNQGMFGQILNMTSFQNTVHPNSISNPTTRGLLTAILELGAWLGVLMNGILADVLGRKRATIAGVFVFIIGVIVQACAKDAGYIYGGRFVTGMGVGTLSMVVPLYNAELAPPELRGALVSLQQLAICFGIMISYWIGYGTNFIGGTGESQSNAAWLVPVCIQILPALILGVGINFMPQRYIYPLWFDCVCSGLTGSSSPRWLMTKGREQECLTVLASLRRKSTEDEGVRLEYLEIRAQHLFEKETSIAKFPNDQGGGFASNVKLGFHEYLSLLTNRSLFKRVVVAVFIMVFQQCECRWYL